MKPDVPQTAEDHVVESSDSHGTRSAGSHTMTITTDEQIVYHGESRPIANISVDIGSIDYICDASSLTHQGITSLLSGDVRLLEMSMIQSPSGDPFREPGIENDTAEIEALVRDLRKESQDLVAADLSANDKGVTSEQRGQYLRIAQTYLYCLSLICGLPKHERIRLKDRLDVVEQVVAPCWIRDFGSRETRRQSWQNRLQELSGDLDTLQDIIDESDDENRDFIIEQYEEIRKKWRLIEMGVSSEKDQVPGDPFVPSSFHSNKDRIGEFDTVVRQLRISEVHDDLKVALDVMIDIFRGIAELEKLVERSQHVEGEPPGPLEREIVELYIRIYKDIETSTKDEAQIQLSFRRHKLELPRGLKTKINAAFIRLRAVRPQILPWLTYGHEQKKQKILESTKRIQMLSKHFSLTASNLQSARLPYVGQAHRDVVAQYDNLIGEIDALALVVKDWRENAPDEADLSLEVLPEDLSGDSASFKIQIGKWKKLLQFQKSLCDRLELPELVEGPELVDSFRHFLAGEAQADTGEVGIGGERYLQAVAALEDFLNYLEAPVHGPGKKKLNLQERVRAITVPYRAVGKKVKKKNPRDIEASFRRLRRSQRRRTAMLHESSEKDALRKTDTRPSRRLRRASGRQRLK